MYSQVMFENVFEVLGSGVGIIYDYFAESSIKLQRTLCPGNKHGEIVTPSAARAKKLYNKVSSLHCALSFK